MACGEPVNGQECYNRGFADGAATVAFKLVESAPSASTNNAMVPCPNWYPRATCGEASDPWHCLDKPCLILRAQHQ